VQRPLDLRLIVVTDRGLAAPRGVHDIVRAAVEAGAPAIQLRDKAAPAAELLQAARALLPVIRAAGALLFINDRIDVALAAGADGVHLGPHDLPLTAARRIAPPELLIGFSTDNPEMARQAERDGASYIGCGAVFGTSTKPEVGDERIGTARLDEVARAVSIPVVGIGGVGTTNIADIARTRASGAAAVGAVMGAGDPAAAVREIMRVWDSARDGNR
jgi:thiamine-phosphate pyrophosphorylase